MNGDSELRLVKRAISGDKDAQKCLFSKDLIDRLSKFIAHKIHPQDVDDITQLTLIEASKSLHGYTGSGSFLGWLFTIAHRQISRYYSKKKSEPQIEPLESIPNTAEYKFEPETSYFQNAELKPYWDALNQLSIDQRHLLIARHRDGLTSIELAEKLGCTPNAINLRIARATMSLKRIMNNQILTDTMPTSLSEGKGSKI